MAKNRQRQYQNALRGKETLGDATLRQLADEYTFACPPCWDTMRILRELGINDDRKYLFPSNRDGSQIDTRFAIRDIMLNNKIFKII